MEELYQKRTGYAGKLENISKAVCRDFNLGGFVSNKIITMGYEDFNFILESAKGKHFVKIFTAYPKHEECRRYVDVMLKALDAEVSLPKLLSSSQSNEYLHLLNLDNIELRLCVMKFIDGKTIYETGEPLSDDEIRFVAQQAALINSIKIKPKYVCDSWAIQNFLDEFKKSEPFLTPEDLELVKPLAKEFTTLNIKSLPHCFVHGDLIKTNIMRDANGKLWLIDFAVSNYYPRIQELAVLACDLLFDAESKTNTEKNLRVALDEYQKKIPLTEKEIQALPAYIKLAHAMHVVRATYEKHHEYSYLAENDYFLSQGRAGLKMLKTDDGNV